MTILFDGRVLTHSIFTGVEHYTESIYHQLRTQLNLSLQSPPTRNKYLAHLWSHLVLPFAKGELLFCPANLAPYFVPKHKKLVITLHDVAFLRYPQSFTPLFRRYYQWLIPHVLTRADRIITISQSSKAEICHYYPQIQEKISVIGLGVEPHFRPLPTPQKHKQLLFVGSLNTRKNFTAVLEAFKRLNRPEYQLIMVGNFSANFALDPTTQALLDEARANPAITFRSNLSTEQLVACYQHATLLLFPSLYEGFGLPPLEAMACGTPVITSHCSSMPEVCGEAATYIDPHDIDDIVAKLTELLDDEAGYSARVAKGIAHAKHFTWEQSATAHLECFRGVLSCE